MLTGCACVGCPTTQAFPPDAGSLPADVLLKVVQFHFCPATTAAALLVSREAVGCQLLVTDCVAVHPGIAAQTLA